MEQEEHVSTWLHLRRAAEVHWARRKLGRHIDARGGAHIVPIEGNQTAAELLHRVRQASVKVEELPDNSTGKLLLAEFG